MKKESNFKLDETQQLIAAQKQTIYQRLRDLGIEVIDATEEWEGTTTIIPCYRPSKNAKNEKENK
jgi:hypothetical protein